MRLLSDSHQLLYKPKVVSTGTVKILIGCCIKEGVLSHFFSHTFGNNTKYGHITRLGRYSFLKTEQLQPNGLCALRK